MKRIFKYSPFILLVVYLAKSFIITPSLFDFGVIFLMSGLFLHTMKLDKNEVSEKEELKAIIAQLEGKVNKRIDELQKSQDNDRLAAEGKFSTLNLGMQHQSRTAKSNSEKPFSWGS